MRQSTLHHQKAAIYRQSSLAQHKSSLTLRVDNSSARLVVGRIGRGVGKPLERRRNGENHEPSGLGVVRAEKPEVRRGIKKRPD